MVFERPKSIPFPQVWARFTTERDGESRRFLIRDALPSEHEQLVGYMTRIFVKHEALVHSLDIESDAAALAALQAEWRRLLRDNTALVCATDDAEGRVAAVNVTYVLERGPAPTEDPKSVSERYGLLYSIMGELLEKANVFDDLECDKYLSALGMLVLPQYRSLGIATQMLKAREPLCKALGLTATSTSFSAAAVQRAAAAAGLRTQAEVRSDQMRGLVRDSPPFVLVQMGRRYE